MSISPNKENGNNPTANKEPVNLILIQTAYKLYKMKSMVSMHAEQLTHEEYILSSKARAIWEDPLLAIHKALHKNGVIHASTSYTYLDLLKMIKECINEHDTLYKSIQRKKEDGKPELLRKLH